MICRECIIDKQFVKADYCSTKGGYLCPIHAKEEVEGLLNALSDADLRLMRRRAEDHCRKDHDDLIQTLADLIIKDRIKYEDVI